MVRRKSRKTKKSNNNKNKFLKVLLLTSAFCCLLFLMILFYFLRQIFSPPVTFQTKMLTPGHIYHQGQVINRLARLLLKSKPGKVCVLTLSQDEVNSLIVAISNSDSLGEFLLSARRVGEPPKQRPYKIVFRDKCFDIQYSVPTDYKTPFGEYINLAVKGTPELDKNGVSLDIKSASAGSLELPPQQVEKIMRILLKKYEKESAFKRIHDVVVKAYITPDNSLVIFFYPYRIRNCLTEGF